MKKSTFLKKLKLDEESLNKITKKVQEAEAKTTGEIVIVSTHQSSTYSFWELLAAVILSAIVFFILVPFSDKLALWLNNNSWQYAAWYIPAFYGLISFSIIALGFYFANIPVIDRLIIPKVIQHRFVTSGALKSFTKSNVYCTKEHSGILLYISYLERQVRIVADTGISEKINQDLWNIIADGLAEGIGKGNTENAIIDSIEKCGELLAEHFPAHKENPDELPDRMIILGDNEWN